MGRRPTAGSSRNPETLTDEQIADVVRPLAALPLWAELLGSAGSAGSAGFVESGPGRWLSPEGRKAELVGDDHLRVALALTKALLGVEFVVDFALAVLHEAVLVEGYELNADRAGKLLALAQTVKL